MITTSHAADWPEDSGPASSAEGTRALTVIVPIRSGRRQQLQQVLAVVSQRIAAGEGSPFDDLGTVHFARWVILPDYGEGGGLLFTSDYDGSWDSYIEDFATKAAQSFDAIYSNCEGWPERGAADIDAFKAYIRKHRLAPDVYYQACPTATVRQVKGALRVKQSWLDLLVELSES